MLRHEVPLAFLALNPTLTHDGGSARGVTTVGQLWDVSNNHLRLIWVDVRRARLLLPVVAMIGVRAGLTEVSVAVIVSFGAECLRAPIALASLWCRVLGVTGVDDMLLQSQGVKGPLADFAMDLQRLGV